MTATETAPVVMARRVTADGRSVQFWDDGSVTHGGLSTYVRGCGVARTAEGREADVRACWLLAGEVCAYETAELPAAVKAARAAVRAEQEPAAALSRFRSAMNPVTKSAKPHRRGCTCFRCVTAHTAGGCRSLHCRTCGMTR